MCYYHKVRRQHENGLHWGTVPHEQEMKASDLYVMIQPHALESAADVCQLSHKAVLLRSSVCDLTLQAVKW